MGFLVLSGSAVKPGRALRNLLEMGGARTFAWSEEFVRHRAPAAGRPAKQSPCVSRRAPACMLEPEQFDGRNAFGVKRLKNRDAGDRSP
jgi:hypothetical protein